MIHLAHLVPNGVVCKSGMQGGIKATAYHSDLILATIFVL